MLALPGCALFSGEVNLSAVHAELQAVHADLKDLSAMMEGDDLEPILDTFSGIVGQAESALKTYIDSGGANIGNLIDALDLALVMSDQMLISLPADDDKRRRIKVGIFIVRAVLRRVDIHLSMQEP